MGHISLTIPDEVTIIVQNDSLLHEFTHKAKDVLRTTGHLPDNSLWNYIEWRREQHPKQFAHYHPTWERMFHHQHFPPPTLPIETPYIPTLPPGSTETQPIHPLPTGGVSEPSAQTLLLFGMMIIALSLLKQGNKK